MIRSQKFKIQAKLDQMNISYLLSRPEITANYADILLPCFCSAAGYTAAKAPAAGHKAGLSGCSKKVYSNMQSGGAKCQSLKKQRMGAGLPFSGEADRRNFGGSAEQRTAAGNFGIRPVAAVFQPSGGAWVRRCSSSLRRRSQAAVWRLSPQTVSHRLDSRLEALIYQPKNT